MKVTLLVLSVAVMAVAAYRDPWGLQVKAVDEARGARTPVLVELFTSEGCSSCPPADAVLARLVAEQPVPNAEIVALGFHVDYWHRLGWRDPFSSAAYTARQNAYADAWRSSRVYTPQAVVDGIHEFIGSDWQAARQYVSKSADARKLAVAVDVSPDPVSPGGVAARIEVKPSVGQILKGDIMLAIAQDGLVTNVQRGENANRRLSHVAVVRSIERIAQFDGSEVFTATRPVALDPAWRRNALKIVVFVQEPRSKRVNGLAARRL